jgi:hypothetical protein
LTSSKTFFSAKTTKAVFAEKEKLFENEEGKDEVSHFPPLFVSLFFFLGIT